MHANTVLILFVKSIVRLFLFVYIAVSAGYSMYYHITMKVCLEL